MDAYSAITPPRWLKAVLVILLVVYCVHKYEARTTPEQSAIAETVATITTAELEHTIRTRAGNPLVLVVYTTWCPYCKKLMTPMLEFSRSYQEKPITFMFLSLDDKASDVARFSSAVGSPFPHAPLIMTDSNEKRLLISLLSKQGGAFRGGIPYVGLFNSKGALWRDIPGYIPPARIDALLKELMAQPK